MHQRASFANTVHVLAVDFEVVDGFVFGTRGDGGNGLLAKEGVDALALAELAGGDVLGGGLGRAGALS